jgi:hypothetical protein
MRPLVLFRCYNLHTKAFDLKKKLAWFDLGLCVKDPNKVLVLDYNVSWLKIISMSSKQMN